MDQLDTNSPEYLSRSKDWQTRFWVAWDSNTPSEVIDWLLKDPDESVRSQAARNKNASLIALLRLIEDNDDPFILTREFAEENVRSRNVLDELLDT